MDNNICVFCGSSNDLAEEYYRVAEELAELIIQKGYGIMHGAGIIGLMGSLIRGCSKQGGRITGVVPESLNKSFIVNDKAQILIVTEDMKSRKAYLRDHSCAFIALAGGFGTLEEVAEVITLKQLKYHTKPIIFLNTLGYYDKLFDFFDQMFDQKFVLPAYRTTYKIVATPAEAMEYIENYNFTNIYDKYLKE
jgi:uncharacterized protein (TIGR00730 family)